MQEVDWFEKAQSLVSQAGIAFSCFIKSYEGCDKV